jgi:pantetheine-phosphate adenylyltransferase
MKRGVYAGTFDPPTLGHNWMIASGAELFDELVVAIGVNPDKKCLFSVEERLEMLNNLLPNIRLVQSLLERPIGTITVEQFGNEFLIEYARSIKATHIIRGIRSVGDYEYERNMRHINQDIYDGITTVFLMPPRESSEVSSRMVKGLVGPNGWEKIVAKYVTSEVLEALKAKHKP